MARYRLSDWLRDWSDPGDAYFYVGIIYGDWFVPGKIIPYRELADLLDSLDADFFMTRTPALSGYGQSGFYALGGDIWYCSADGRTDDIFFEFDRS